MNAPVNVPVDDPRADTEWNDILRKHKIIPEKPPSPTPLIEEAIANAREQAYEKRLEGKDLDGLDELEDDEDDEFLEQYRYVGISHWFFVRHSKCNRRQRMAELATISKTSIFNQVYPLQKPDYSREVTDASKTAFVFVHLTSSLGTNTESRLLSDIWRELARKFGDIKFCEMRADMCIEGYPDKNTPTILVYHDGDIKRQLITLKEMGGVRTSIRGTHFQQPAVSSMVERWALIRFILDLEQVLVEVGALDGTDIRLARSDPPDDSSAFTGRRIKPRSVSADDEDDWD
ncbi:MAG: hypothetical protein Q9222_004073 [Ikaeria aurantiellina]